MRHPGRLLVVLLMTTLSACSPSAAVSSPIGTAPASAPHSPLPSPTPFAGGSAWPIQSAQPSETPDVSAPGQMSTPEPTAGSTTNASPTTAPPSLPSATPVPIPPSCAIRTLDAMTEEQRIGQLFMIGLTNDQLTTSLRSAIATYHFGSVLFAKRTSVGAKAVRAVADAVQAQASASATHGVAFFVAANQEGGQVQALSGTGFAVIPSALQQGTMSTAALQASAKRWGAQLRDAGVNLDLAPIADVVPPGTDAQNAPIGRYDREYAHDPTTAGSHVAAFVAGMRDVGIGTTVKHFPGLGRVIGNTDFTANVVDDVTTRRDPYLAPFGQAIAAGVPFVMISEATYPQIDPRHMGIFSNTVINGMLRGDLGFHGVVISDSLGSVAVADMSPGDRAIDFLDAGGDMIVLNQLDQAIAMARAVQALAAQKDWFRDRIENAAWHVLRAKEAAGLLDCE